MSEAKKQILQMLQDGKVTADQAMELLQAVTPTGESETFDSEEPEPLTGDIIQPSAPPDMGRFRQFWQIPFFIALGALIVSGLGLRSLYRSSEGNISFWFICVWSIFVFTFILAMLAFMSRNAAWVHVRVKERGGRRISISLPLPLSLASWVLKIIRGFVGDEEREKLDLAASLITAARENLKMPGSDPLMVNVNDDDGEQVQVYIG